MSVAQLTEFTQCDYVDYVDFMPRQTSLTGLLRSVAGPVQNPGGGARADPVQADGPGVAAEARAGNMEPGTLSIVTVLNKTEDDLPVRCAECGGWQSSDSGGSDSSPGSGNSTSGHIYRVII